MNEIEKAIQKLKSADSHHTQAQYNLDDETIEMAVSALEKQLTERWISVSERFPETNKDVQVTFREYMKWNEKYRYGICKAIYIPEHSIKSENMGWDNCEDVEDYDEAEDTYYIKSGWYEVVENWSDYTHVYINCEVTAWQSLPKPYKEENEQ